MIIHVQDYCIDYTCTRLLYWLYMYKIIVLLIIHVQDYCIDYTCTRLLYWSYMYKIIVLIIHVQDFCIDYTCTRLLHCYNYVHEKVLLFSKPDIARSNACFIILSAFLSFKDILLNNRCQSLLGKHDLLPNWGMLQVCLDVPLKGLFHLTCFY